LDDSYGFVSYVVVITNKTSLCIVKMFFRFVQKSIEVLPGETALAFYQATNHTDKPIIGVSTYNVVPMRVGLYFTKIQCFCFEEQRLNPGETVNMPVLFYIHPDILDDPQTTVRFD
jgi:cytochrome c oxidase assembly protein subunit 11